jgi:excisionase family DNA binding protein
MSRQATSKPTPQPISSLTPRLVRISEAAHYLSCSYHHMEDLIRSKTIPSAMLGKRRVVDIRDLDEYAESVIQRDAA